MRLLISNPSILVALEQVDLLEPLFTLPIKIVVTDFLYERELKNYDGQRLVELGLQIQRLEPQMTTLATEHRQSAPTLCRDEVYTLVLAQLDNFVLLTINPDLVKLAQAKDISYYSLSSLLQLMLDQSLLAQSVLTQRVTSINVMARCPLIRREAKAYLSKVS